MDVPFNQAAAAAEAAGDWSAAIALVGAYAECYSKNPDRHNAHLWHIDLPARAGRLEDLANFAGD